MRRWEDRMKKEAIGIDTPEQIWNLCSAILYPIYEFGGIRRIRNAGRVLSGILIFLREEAKLIDAEVDIEAVDEILKLPYHGFFYAATYYMPENSEFLAPPTTDFLACSEDAYESYWIWQALKKAIIRYKNPVQFCKCGGRLSKKHLDLSHLWKGGANGYEQSH